MMRRYILFFVAVSICAGIGLSLACSNKASEIDAGGASLGNYKDSLSKLFPERVGDFKRLKAESINDRRIEGSTEMYVGFYESDKSSIRIAAANFPSTDDAQKRMKEIIELQKKMFPNSDSMEGDKRKASIIVGIREQGHGGPPDRRSLGVTWTNGSVLFILEGADFAPMRIQETERIGLKAEERDKLVLEFERDFPY